MWWEHICPQCGKNKEFCECFPCEMSPVKEGEDDGIPTRLDPATVPTEKRSDDGDSD